jgi:hypothetical protein
MLLEWELEICFEFTAINWLPNCYKYIIGLTLDAKKKIVINEIVHSYALNSF